MRVVRSRLVLSALLSAALTALAAMATVVTRAPAVVSLALEPFSLLLLPGVAFAMVEAAPRDFTPAMVLAITAVLYAVVFYMALTWRANTRRQRAESIHESR